MRSERKKNADNQNPHPDRTFTRVAREHGCISDMDVAKGILRFCVSQCAMCPVSKAPHPNEQGSLLKVYFGSVFLVQCTCAPRSTKPKYTLAKSLLLRPRTASCRVTGNTVGEPVVPSATAASFLVLAAAIKNVDLQEQSELTSSMFQCIGIHKWITNRL